MASDTTTPAPPNKAEAEFAKYAQRRAAESGHETPLFGAPGSGPFAAGNLGWTVPMGMTPVYMGGPPPGGGAPGASGGPGPGAGGLADGIGTTVRLGVDLLNAMLSSSVKVLGGFAGAYGSGHQEDCGCSGGCGCESCCEPACCQPSCCACECCNPSVGSCC